MAVNVIKDALSKLDASDDAHWTNDGAPRLDVLKKFLGVAATRDEVNKAAPGFNRDAASGAAQAATTPATAATAETPATDVASEEGTAEADETQPKANVPAVTNPDQTDPPKVDERAVLMEQLTEAKADLERAIKAHSDAAREVQNQTVIVDQLTDKLLKVAPPNTFAESINGYLARQQEEREARGARVQAVRASGVDLKALVASVSRSPIDAAMARANKRGLNRPKR